MTMSRILSVALVGMLAAALAPANASRAQYLDQHASSASHAGESSAASSADSPADIGHWVACDDQRCPSLHGSQGNYQVSFGSAIAFLDGRPNSSLTRNCFTERNLQVVKSGQVTRLATCIP
jgi:hypothetical protein